MAKPADIVINEWQQGIAESPHVGFADMRNVDIYSTPGIVQLGYLPSKVSGATVTDLCKWFTKDPVTGNLYALGDAQKLYKSTDGGASWSHVSGNTTTNGKAHGLAVWKNYVFVARDAAVDVLKISDDTWTNSFQTLTSVGTTTATGFHPMLWGQDDILYIGNGRYVASLAETSGSTFDPATASTYTWTAQALTLPAQYKIKCLAELGTNLMIGTWIGTNIYDFRNADIFPWDRSSTSFRLPIRIHEAGVSQMLVINNILYIAAGVYGRLYVSNGISVQELKTIRHISIASGDWIHLYPGAIIFHNDRVLFGVSHGSGNSSPMGVFGIRGKTLTMENTISTGSIGDSNTLIIGALLSLGYNQFLIGWQDSTSYGIDRVTTSFSTRYTTYTARIDSPLIQVGTPRSLRTFTELEFELAKPLTTGQGIKISYRKNLTDAFTVLGTYDFATYAGIQGYIDAAPITDAQFVQLRVELTTGSSSTTTPELRSVTLR